jgi:hypothetical protein
VSRNKSTDLKLYDLPAGEEMFLQSESPALASISYWSLMLIGAENFSVHGKYINKQIPWSWVLHGKSLSYSGISQHFMELECSLPCSQEPSTNRKLNMINLLVCKSHGIYRGKYLEINVYLKNSVFWDVVPCRSCVNRRFGVKYRLHLQGR